MASEAHATLKTQIDLILKNANLSRSPVSIQIVDLRDGAVLYEKNQTLSLNPASNAKIVTAATALHELGPDYTFKTEFFSDTLIDEEGRINNLWIKGYGDPLFVTEQLEGIVKRFRAAGLKKIEGQVFVDDTYFDRYHRTTYLSDIHRRAYSILTSPLSFNWNRTRARTRQGIKNLENLDPATATGTRIVEALRGEGIEVQGEIKREAVPREELVIMTHQSPPLKEILKGMGKQSNNFIAEQLVKTMAAHHFGPPGSTSQGLTLMGQYLVSLGIPSSSFRLDNGSGLSRISRLSSEQLVKVLTDLYRSRWRDDFISSLSIAGIDGTIKSKMREPRLRGRVFAKTGTLDDVSALSGYLFDKKQPIVYSLLFNDFSISLRRMKKVQEKILEAVADTL